MLPLCLLFPLRLGSLTWVSHMGVSERYYVVSSNLNFSLIESLHSLAVVFSACIRNMSTITSKNFVSCDHH